jgi:hypothetical protein
VDEPVFVQRCFEGFRLEFLLRLGFFTLSHFYHLESKSNMVYLISTFQLSEYSIQHKKGGS